jgi:hypothetical protein
VRAGVRNADIAGHPHRGKSRVAAHESDMGTADVRAKPQRIHKVKVESGSRKTGTRNADEVSDGVMVEPRQAGKKRTCGLF